MTDYWIAPSILSANFACLGEEVDEVFGGQKFIPGALRKLREVRSRIDKNGYEIRLEIDGGVKIDNIREIAAAGADTFVAGSAIFGSGDFEATIAAMRSELELAKVTENVGEG